MRLTFAKYEGLGNDFIVVGRGLEGSLDTAAVVALCDRHRGIGADGVLFAGATDATSAAGATGATGAAGATSTSQSMHLSMRVVNADGTVPEMCGNGLRCVALHLARQERVPAGGRFVIHTDAGPHACRIVAWDEQDAQRGVARVEVAMRAPSLAPGDVPVVADAPLVEQAIPVGGRELHITALSMGNPHAVVFDEVGAQREELGPALAGDARFPEGVNVGFARMRSPTLLELAVLERGVGWTRACGTGACAAAVAAVETGRAVRGASLRVQLPGGPLDLVVGAPGQSVMMTGEARHVFDGVIERA